MKSLRDEMEIVNAYELVGTYRGAAALCGTTAKTVKRVLERRTAVVIAHRISTLRDADLIGVLEQGRLVELGTPQQLMEREGLYYYLNTVQLAP